MAECVWEVGAELGEGPIWRAADRTIWFVDIKGRKIHCYDTVSKSGRSWSAPDQPGFVAPVRDGRFVAGLKTGLHLFDPTDGSFNLLSTVEPDRPGNVSMMASSIRKAACGSARWTMAKPPTAARSIAGMTTC